MTERRWMRLLAALLALALVAAACGDDDGDGDGADPEPSTSEGTDGEDTDGEDTDGEDTDGEDTDGEDTDGEDTDGEDTDGETADGVYDLGGGAVLDVNTDCPSSWDPTQGLTDDEILIGMSLPESGVLASFGTLDDGMQVYFDSIEPIEGRKVRVISADDAFDPGRTETNVEEIIDTEGVFAFATSVGTANTLRVRGLLDEECIPLVFASSGAPELGDPAEFPFLNNGLLSYAAEALAWCSDISATLGEGATVGAIYQNNDFGKAYQRTFEQCAADEGLEIVASELHDPAAPDISSELTTIASANPDALVVGTTSVYCPQSVIGIRSNNIDPEIYVSATCAIIGLFWQPQGAAVDGFRMMQYALDVSDPQYADNDYVVATRQLLEDAGIDPEEGSYATGVQFATALEAVLRQAAASDEGLTRATVVEAMWNLDTELAYLLPGARAVTNGNDDAYIFEAGEMVVYTYDDGTDTGAFVGTGSLYDYDGQLGNFTSLVGEE